MKSLVRTLAFLLLVVGIVIACVPAPAPTPVPPTAAPKPAATSVPAPQPPIATSAPSPAPSTQAVAPTSIPVPPTGAAKIEPKGKLTISVFGDNECWNPLEGPCGASIRYHDLIMERLVTWDRDLKLAPGLAISWKAIDGLTWEFKLRQGVKFTNGETFDAQAVVFMFDAILKPQGRKTPATTVADYRPLAKIEVIDNYTVRFITKEPFPLLPNGMAFEPRAVPPKYYAQVGMDAFGQKPIGTGPYKLVEWVKNDHFTVEANLDYWGTLPTVKQLVFRPIPEETTRLAELLSGGVDIIERVPSDLVPQLDKSNTVHKETTPSLNTLFVNLRPEDKITNKALREAFEYATNVDSIIKEVAGGLADKLGRGNSVTEYEFGNDLTIPEWPYDLEKARQKVKESGYDGREIKMFYPEGEVASIDQVAQALQAQWAQAGLKVSVTKQEYGLWRQNWSARTIPGDIFLKTSAAKNMDSDARLVPSVHCFNEKTGMGRVSFFCDPEIDKLIEEAQVTVDMSKRAALYSKAWRMHRDAAHHVALYTPRVVYGVSNKVEWKPTIEGLFTSLVQAKLK